MQCYPRGGRDSVGKIPLISVMAKLFFFPYSGVLESTLGDAGLLQILSYMRVSAQFSTLQVTLAREFGKGLLAPLVWQPMQ